MSSIDLNAVINDLKQQLGHFFIQRENTSVQLQQFNGAITTCQALINKYEAQLIQQNEGENNNEQVDTPTAGQAA